MKMPCHITDEYVELPGEDDSTAPEPFPGFWKCYEKINEARRKEIKETEEK